METGADREQGWDIVSGVGVTALAVAAARAAETASDDALIRDPHAAQFVAAARPAVPLPVETGEIEWSALCTNVAVRTRVFDDFLRGAVDSGIDQVVLLAAGLDARAYRLPLPAGATCFEIDQPDVLDFKLRVLRDAGASPGCHHHPVRCDLRKDWAAALEQAGFDRTRPTAWLAEGLLAYLPADAEQRLFEQIRALSAMRSRICAEYIDRMGDVLADGLVPTSMGQAGIDIAGLVHADARPSPEQQLAGLGWQVRTVTAHRAAGGFGRTLPEIPFRHFVHLHGELGVPAPRTPAMDDRGTGRR